MTAMRMGPVLRTSADDTGAASAHRRRRRPRIGLRGAGLDLWSAEGESADAGDGGDLLDRRLADALHRAEDAEQRAAAARADAGQVVELGADRRLAPQVAVVGDREAVRLVADALDEVQRLRGRSAAAIGSARSGQDQLLALLGEPGERQVVQPELVEDAPSRRRPGACRRRSGRGPASPSGAPRRCPRRPAARRGTGAAGPRGARRRRSGPRPCGRGTGGTPRSAACRPRTRPCSRRSRCPGSSRRRSTRSGRAARAGPARRRAPRGRPGSCPGPRASAPARARASPRRCASRAA